MTNYQGGVASFGLPIFPALPGGPVANAPSAAGSGPVPNVYFVSSVLGTDGSAGKKMAYPLATLKQALTLVLPGDTIYLMPGHVENVIAANGVDVTVKNITVIGLGSGNQRPTIVFKTAAAATFRLNAVTADGFYLYNVRVQSQVAALAIAFDVQAKDVTFDTVDYYDDGASDVTTMFRVAGINCTIKNCSWELEVANSATLNWITLNAAHGFRCYSNYGYFLGLATANPANGVVVGVTALTKHVDIRANFFAVTAGGTASVLISMFAASTGVIAYNNCLSNTKTASLGTIATANCGAFQNFSSHGVGAASSGLLDPAVTAG